MSEIRTWDTDSESSVAWGTHDPLEAVKAYKEEHGTEDNDTPDFEGFSVCMWARPDMENEEFWPMGSYSGAFVEGWIPILVCAW